MEEETKKVFQLNETRTTIIREDKEKIIFEKNNDRWLYLAPNAQTHNETQLELILAKLRELNLQD